MRSRRQLFFFVGLVIVGCGSRTELGIFELTQATTGGSSMSGGSSSRAGASSRGGAMASAGSSAGGAAGTSVAGAAGSVSEGGAGGGEPSAGEAGAAGSFGGAAGGEPNGGGAAGEGGSAGEPAAPLAVDLALGAFTSCAGFDDGSLRCWGSRTYIGSASSVTIGDDETPDAVPPVQIGGRVLQLTASWYHTCALLDSGDIRCFGSAGAGALGYGNKNHIGDDETPASAGNVNVGRMALQVSAGPYHTCAVLDNLRVRCWGRNEHWQLGRAEPATIGDDEAPVSIDFVDVGASVVQVAAGYGHTCVLLDTAKVRCWGWGQDGQLGYANTESIGDNETPASAGDVDVGGPVIQIVAGTFRTCALLDTGKVRCWGRGYGGGLGYGNTESIGDDETPASAGDVDVGGTVKMLAAGDYATCALLVGGKVRCWGGGGNGELGYASTDDVGDDETPASMGDVDVGGSATRVDVGFLHTCVTLETGKVRCWGRASTGALGYGNIHDIGDDEAPALAGDVKLQ